LSDIRSGAAAPAEVLGEGTRRCVLTILVIACTCNFIDRQIPGLLFGCFVGGWKTEWAALACCSIKWNIKFDF